MPSSARDNPLKVLPEIAEKAPLRAAQIGERVSGYVATLIWNYAQAPWKVAQERDAPDLVRVKLPCYLRKGVGDLAEKLAGENRLSLNAFVEALLAADLRSSEPGLTRLPKRGSVRPSI